MQTPCQGHRDVAMRILRPLTGSLRRGILLPSDNPLQLYIYYDSDLGNCRMSHRSGAGCLVQAQTCTSGVENEKTRYSFSLIR